jgi:hypothetical protein
VPALCAPGLARHAMSGGPTPTPQAARHAQPPGMSFAHGAMSPVLQLTGAEARPIADSVLCEPPRRWIVRRVQNVRFWLTLPADCAVIAATCRRTWVPRSCRRPPDGCCSVRLGTQASHRRIEGAESVLEVLTVSCSRHAGCPGLRVLRKRRGVMSTVKNVVLVHGGWGGRIRLARGVSQPDQRRLP